MAEQVVVKFVDDLDGSEAKQTLTYTVDGKKYAIDLSDENAAKFLDALAPFIAVSRRDQGRRHPKAQATPTIKEGRMNRDEAAEIRAWARQHGHDIADRGRIPKSVVEAYKAAA